MRSRTLLPVLVFLTLLAIGAGCIEDPATGPTTPAAKTDVALIGPEALGELVPQAPSGWRMLATPSPVLLDENGVPLVSVTASYLSDDGNRSADLTIQDTGGRSVGLRRLVDPIAAIADGATAPTRTTLRGQPAFLLSDGRVTGTYLVVADRYVIGLVVTDGTRADTDAFVAAMELEGLERQR